MNEWSANEQTGAIFNGEGVLIGVADPTSAKSIVASHNATLERRRPTWDNGGRKSQGFRNEYTIFDELHTWDDRDEALRDAVRDGMNEAIRRETAAGRRIVWGTPAARVDDFYRRKAPQEPADAPDAPDSAFYRRTVADDE